MTSLLVNAPPHAPASPILVSDLILRVKQRADIEKSGSSGVISDSEMLRLIQQGARMLDACINKAYEYYTMQYYCFVTVANQLRYGLPSDFHKLLSIGLVDQLGPSPNTWTPLAHWDRQMQNNTGTGFFNFTNGVFTYMQYRIAGGNVELRPVKSAQNVGIYYTPQAPALRNTGDYLPAYYQPGWEEYIVNWAAFMVAAKRQQATDVHQTMWKEIQEQVSSFVPNRDSANPETVTHSWVRSWLWPGSQGNPYGAFGGW